MADPNPYRPPAADAPTPGGAQFRSLRDLQALLTPLLVADAVMTLVVAIIAFVQPAVVDANAEFTTADLVMAGALLIYVIVVVTTMITFGRFLVRSNVNARSFGRFVHFTPASMVWWHFVPFANLVKPYEAFKAVWQASGGDRDFSSKHPQMGLWWGSWIVANILGNFSWRAPDSAQGVLALVNVPPTAAACYLGIVITRALTERQDETAMVAAGRQNANQ